MESQKTATLLANLCCKYARNRGFYVGTLYLLSGTYVALAVLEDIFKSIM